MSAISRDNMAQDHSSISALVHLSLDLRMLEEMRLHIIQLVLGILIFISVFFSGQRRDFWIALSYAWGIYMTL